MMHSPEDALSREGKGQVLASLEQTKEYDETDRVLSHADIGGRNSCLMNINSFRTETLSVFTLPSQCLHTTQLFGFNKYLCTIVTYLLFWSLPVMPALFIWVEGWEGGWRTETDRLLFSPE